MKTGEFFNKGQAILDGYTFYCFFAQCIVYRKGDTYIFIDLRTDIIQTILISG